MPWQWGDIARRAFDGRIAVGSWDPVIQLWDPDTGGVVAELEGHRFSVYALAVLLDGRLASGSSDKTIRLWDPEIGMETARPERHSGAVNALAVFPNGRLISGSDDRTIRFWDALVRKGGAPGSQYNKISILLNWWLLVLLRRG